MTAETAEAAPEPSPEVADSVSEAVEELLFDPEMFLVAKVVLGTAP